MMKGASGNVIKAPAGLKFLFRIMAEYPKR